MPLISVIVPVYQVEAYLEYCLDSILNQTYSNFELILVNDGSTDRSGDICQEYARKDARVRLFYQANQGLSAARNTGLDVCRGEYITFVDSDDFVEADYLESFLWLAQNQDADIVITPYHLYRDDTRMYEFLYFPVGEGEYSQLSHQEVIDAFDGPLYFLSYGVCGRLYKKEIFENVRFPIGRVWEDEATLTKLYMQADSIYLLHKTTYWYRQREESIMHSELTLQMCEDAIFTVKERLMDLFLSPDGLDLELQKQYTFRRLRGVKQHLEKLQEMDSNAYKEVIRLLSYQNREG